MSAVQANLRELSKQSSTTALTPATLSDPGKSGSQLVIIVERKEDWASYFPSEDVMTAQEYLEQPRQNEVGKRVQVINLCRSYKYLGHGYYCSLLAEARGHKVIPSVRTISELTRKSLYGLALDDLDKTLEKALGNHPYSNTEGFTLSLYFGKTDLEPLQDLARQLFEAFPSPILLVEFRKSDGWHIAEIKSGALHKLRDDQQDQFANSLDSFSRKIWRQPRSRRVARYDLAILHDPQEELPPSNAKALEGFIRVGKTLGIDVELIERKDYSRLAEYDALLIRETTSVDNHTYRFAKKAESEGLVVMDDPASILRCTNKVYLTDLLKSHQLGMPATEILYKDRPQDFEQISERLGFPLVLKIPDGCFSRGVIKVENQEALLKASAELFRAPRRELRAVHDVSFSLGAGETLGVVGESGCGKSTLGRCLVGLYEPAAGEILWRGKPLRELGDRQAISRKIQMIFQDPYSSLNPRMSLEQTLDETLRVHGIGSTRAERAERIDELLLTVGLAPRLKDRMPHAFSGGQRQRISIARALAVGPELIVADEPVSALDASVQAQIINLFEDIRDKLGVAFLFIAHDLSVVRHISQRIAVMYLGQSMELADADTLFESPRHPYTRALLSAIPLPDPDQRSHRVSLEGELPDPFDPPKGCAFSTRCPFVIDACRKKIPALCELDPTHHARCLPVILDNRGL